MNFVKVKEKFSGMTSHPFFIIFKFEIKENIRNKWLMIYGISFFLFSSLIMYSGSDTPLKAVASELSFLLLIVPLFSLIFGAISFSESFPFMEVILARKITRVSLYFGKYAGLCGGLIISFSAAMTLSAILFFPAETGGIKSFSFMLFLGIILIFVFSAFSLFLANYLEKKETLIGVMLLFWFYFYILYDLLILSIGSLFGDYPIEPALFIMIMLNPIDIVRVILLLHLDITTLLGFTSAFFQKYLGSKLGIYISFSMIMLWIVLPLYFGFRKFKHREI
ncbi:MAG: hypothetical protein OEZ22_11285 [Spirochaetia bacterium]|nr:hypothetical protein [Spirochaetia bacterium]